MGIRLNFLRFTHFLEGEDKVTKSKTIKIYIPDIIKKISTMRMHKCVERFVSDSRISSSHSKMPPF